MPKPNCYRCKHRSAVPGSAHSRCKHPAFEVVGGNPLGELMAVFASVGRVPPVQQKPTGIVVRGSLHGIRRGWFNHPYNFDPVWLKECSGFEAKEVHDG